MRVIRTFGQQFTGSALHKNYAMKIRLLHLCLFILIASCSNGLDKKVEKKWKVVSFDVTPGTEVSEKDKAMIKASGAMFEDVVYKLDDTGEFTLMVAGTPRNKGKYVLNEEDSTIVFGIQGMKEKYRITSITDSNLVLQSTIKPVEMRFSALEN